MPAASFRVLTDYFQNHLHFTPRAADVDIFEADLARVSPTLIGAALREVSASGKLKGARSDWRRAIFTVYYRKVAEHAQLFPAFHAFETGFRSLVAVRLEAHYTLPRWWEPIQRAVQQGNAPGSVYMIQGKPVSNDAANAISAAVEAISRRPSVAAALSQSGYDFADQCEMSHIANIITEHWHVFGPLFSRGQGLTKNGFKAKFRRVREARNDVYHHRSFSGMRDVFETVEELLDHLDYSLSVCHDAVTINALGRPAFRLPVQPRHHAF